MSAVEPGLGPVAALLEALLFAAAEPLAASRLAGAAELPEAQVRRALGELAAHLEAGGHGVTLVEAAGGFQLLTRAEHAAAVAALVAPRPAPLSRAALETLAIIALRQPVTRAAIDELRGVHSEGALGTLLERGLIREAGRAEAPGRPFLYGTSRRFLEHFGLRSLEELRERGPTLPALQRLLPAAAPEGDSAQASAR